MKILLVISVVAMSLISCKKQSDKYEIKTSEGSIVVEEDGENISLSSEDGNISVESNDGVSTMTSKDADGKEFKITNIERENQPYPGSFPQEFKSFVEGNNITHTTESKKAEENGYQIVYRTKDDPKSVTESFKKAYPKSTEMITTEDGSYEGFITVSEKKLIITIEKNAEESDAEVIIISGNL